MNQESAFDPTVLGAIWRYRWLVAAIVVAFLVAGLLLAGNQPDRFEATATLVVQDPRSTAVFDSGAVVRPERYVNNQASIITSEVVADRASELAVAEGESITREEIVDNLQVNVFVESDEIGVVFSSLSPTRSVVVANAVAEAYEESRLESVSRAYRRAIEQLDVSILELEQRTAEISNEISALITANPARSELEQQYQEALAKLVELQAALASAVTEERKTELRAEIADVRDQIETADLVLSLEQSTPQVIALLTEQGQLIDRQDSLRARLDEVEVDASLESTGIVLFSPAIQASETGSGLLQVVVASLLLGGVVAAVVAYRRAVLNRRFTDRTQPEQLLGVPLLAEIPDFKEEKVGMLPVGTDPSSQSAEAFRFIIPAMNRSMRLGTIEGGNGLKSIAMLSAASGDGKTVITANLAVAAALQQVKVLAIDADFGDQQLTKLLVGSNDFGPGMSDLDESATAWRDIVQTVNISGYPPFDLVSRGSAAITAPEFFGSDRARTFFDQVKADYDVVLVDAPPLLQVAYSSLLAGFSDGAIVIVPHGSSVSLSEDLADRLELLDVVSLGYVYTKAPLRLDLPRHSGSMADVLGVGGSPTGASSKDAARSVWRDKSAN